MLLMLNGCYLPQLDLGRLPAWKTDQKQTDNEHDFTQMVTSVEAVVVRKQATQKPRKKKTQAPRSHYHTQTTVKQVRLLDDL